MDNILRRLQLTQLEMLKVVDKFCAEHSIKYSLYAGTLLGAVRHKGFIPWDDDLDICMPREDYERFIELWQHYAPAGFVLQNKENTSVFTQSFTKLRKDHTTFLQPGEEKVSYHTGIFIDIFPFDRIPDRKINRVKQKLYCMVYNLLTKERVPGKTNWNIFERLAARILLGLVKGKKRVEMRNEMLIKLTKYNFNTELGLVSYATIQGMSTIYRKDSFEEPVKMLFEDQDFLCFACWDENLKAEFGDYMTPPPVSERVWTHHPIVIDFEHNYNEIKKG